MKKLWQFKINFIKKNPILSSYISFVKGVIITIVLCSLLSSCKISYYPSYSRGDDKIEQILGVTKSGDTIQVPIDYFENKIKREYDFELQSFYWRNSWYGYNPNLYNRNWFYRSWWWNPYTPIIIQNTRPRYSQPRVRTRRNEVKPQPNRGRSNQQPRQPQYVRPSQQRTRVVPNTNRNNNRNTNTPLRRSGNNTRTKNN